MDQKKIISAQTEVDIWQQVSADFAEGIPHDYHVIIQHNNRNVELNVVSSPGGNIEGGYEYTTLRSPVAATHDFEFLIQPEDFLNRIGKFFGGQDVVLGYPEFDKNVLVKTNNPERLKSLFADEETRELFIALSGYSFGITTSKENEKKELELHIQRLIAVEDLRHAFAAFTKALELLERQV
ncbi:MAG TPA: hypothetical protein VF622_12065 [Segetibacter sp.]|jgi:hypothetical protein